MKKIPSVFQRNYKTDRLIRDEVVPGCEWVLNGEGVATVKWDGTACMVRHGVLYKRYDAKKGKTPPEGWEPCEEAPDENTGHWPGWMPIGGEPEDKWHREAFLGRGLEDGTYELVGYKVQGNPHNLPCTLLWRHGTMVLDEFPRTFEGMRQFLKGRDVEGVVFHHPDGRMAKVKRKDFGFEWPVRQRDG